MVALALFLNEDCNRSKTQWQIQKLKQKTPVIVVSI
jgi:hypothetical protein